jgi:hypothetical protein
MADTSDLFIVGAGASVPYGFPTGESLFDEIRELNYRNEYLKDENCKNDYFKYFGKIGKSYDMQTTMKLMYNFTVDIKESSMVSIDDFLRNRKKLNDIQNKFGKMVIAKKILDAERNSKTKIELKNKIDWFNYLFSFIDRDDNLFNDFFNNSTFITFNYDRLLEYKILEFLCYDKNFKEEEASKKLEKVKIIHVNGCLGNLRDIEFGKNEEKEWNSWEKDYDIIYPDYFFMIDNMKTIWEYDDNDIKQKQNDIMKIFEKSTRIFFIGFGWLEYNMKLLCLDNIEKNLLDKKKLYGTALGISEYKIKLLENGLKLCGACELNIKNCNAVDLIKDFFKG